jgi:serine protease Do
VLLAGAILLTLVGTAAARPYAWLGVRIRDLSEQEMEELAKRHGVREGFGVYIVDTVEGAPAQRSGIKKGDIVVAVNGRPIVETRLLQKLVSAAGLEKEVRLTVLRAEGRSEVAVRLGVMPTAMVGERVAADFGFVMREIEAPPPTEAATPAGSSAIIAIMRGSAAERAGLTVGDVIVEVNGQDVGTGVAAREALADVDSARPLRLTFRRAGASRSVTLSP